MNIDWSFSFPQIFLNPRMSWAQQALLKAKVNALEDYDDHIWVATSGSTSVASEQIKLAALSKKAILDSAKAVNDHLESNRQDRWINPLPEFHVGGLGIWARSFLSRAKVFPFLEKWIASNFCNFIIASKGTLTSLVPAQVYDIVIQKLQAPATLRAIVVGGGALSQSLYIEAKELGWNLLPSYGMTECCSQIATAIIGKEEFGLKILPHVQIKLDEKGLIILKSTSLLTTYLLVTQKNVELIDPKKEGWLETQDLGVINGDFLTLLGREGEFIKIGGEGVQMQRLENILDDIKTKLGFKTDLALVAAPDKRLGHVIHLVITDSTDPTLPRLIEGYHQQVMPFEKIRQIHTVNTIPRTPLKKLLKQELSILLGFFRN